MTQAVSPRHYRNDSFDGLSEDMRKYLDAQFLESLPNRKKHNPKLLVVFSGGNGVGKSSLSSEIQQVLNGVVIENDAIKLHILNYNPAISHDELQHITWRYTMDLYGRVGRDVTNGLIVRDGVIDWYYDRILPVFEAQGYELFIIAYDLSRQKSIDLIKKRGDKHTVSAERLINILEDHSIHQKRFRQKYTADFTFTDDNLFNYDEVITLLKHRIEELKQIWNQ